MSNTRIAPQAQSQLSPPTWLRWVSGHTLTCAILAWASATLALPMGTWAERLWSQLPLAALLCVLHGLTIALQRRGGAGRAPLALVALPAILAGLLFVPLTLGIPAVGGTLARMITLALAGALVSLALQPLADPDGRQSARVGASALTWALTALADSVLGPTMQRAPIGVAPAAVLSGALSGALSGLAGAWLAAGAWDAVRDMGEPRPGRRSLLGVAGRWLLGCALIGASVGVALEIMEPMTLGVQILIAPATLAGIIGTGGGLVRAWLRGESHRLAWRRAMLGMSGALLGFALAFFPAATFMYIYPLTAVLIVAGCVGLGAGVGQDIGAKLEAGPSPWWPIATTIAVSVALVGAGEAIRTSGFGLIEWTLWSGATGPIITLTAIVLAALAGGVAGLPLVLLAARGWSPHRRQRHAR